MKKSKRMFARFFVLVMVLGVTLSFNACNPNVDTGPNDKSGDGNLSARPDEMVELVVYSQTSNYSGEQVGWAAEILKEKFNVKFTIINESPGTFTTRMASKNLGDIVIFGSDGKFQEAVDAGLLFDWEEDDILHDYGTYIYDNMQVALDKNRGLTGGKVHGFGFDVAGSSNDHQAHIYYPYLRWDLYEQLGFPEINTLEDYIPILQAMNELEPVSPQTESKTYAVSSFPDWDGDMVMMVKATAALYGWEEFGLGLYNVIDQSFQGSLEKDGMYLRSLKFYNDLFQLGLYDPDSMTQTFDDATQKYKNGISFFNIFTFVAETFNSQENLENGRSLQCVPAKDQLNLVEGLSEYGKDRVWSIGSKTNYPELCMEIINWLCTPEGVLTTNYGPKGVCWDYDENGDTYMTETGIAARANKKKTDINYNGSSTSYKDGEFQHNLTTWALDAINPESASGESFNWNNWKSTVLLTTPTETEKSWREWAGTITADEFLRKEGHVAVSVGTSYAIPKKSAELDITWEQVKKCITSNSWKAIYAKDDAEFDKIVDTMISDAKKYGYDACIEWVESEVVKRRAEEAQVKGQG